MDGVISYMNMNMVNISPFFLSVFQLYFVSYNIALLYNNNANVDSFIGRFKDLM